MSSALTTNGTPIPWPTSRVARGFLGGCARVKESKKRKKERGRERETETETTSIKLARRGAGNKIAAIKSEACHSRLNGETWKTWRAVKVAEVYPAGVEVAREEERRKRKRERERERKTNKLVHTIPFKSDN